jgi:hypothetical protein
MIVDPTEKLVESYLRHVGYTAIQYEPDGNIPPDFLVDGRIAIEVRRLNQNYHGSSGSKGLEEVSIPLRLKIRKLLSSLGPPNDGKSWFVYYRFSRPAPDWKMLRPKLKNTLQAFMAQSGPKPFDIELVDNFSLRVIRSSIVRRDFFISAGDSDRQSGGWLINEMETNIKYCISEKTLKIANVRIKYPEWWLILPDYIGYGLDNFDMIAFRKQAQISHTFDKVIILNPNDHARAFGI